MRLRRTLPRLAHDVPLGVHGSGLLGRRNASFEGVGHPVARVLLGDGVAPAQERGEVGEWVDAKAQARGDEAHEEGTHLGPATGLERERVVMVLLGELGTLLGIRGGEGDPRHAQERTEAVRVAHEGPVSRGRPSAPRLGVTQLDVRFVVV